jgi:hypothetical protein
MQESVDKLVKDGKNTSDKYDYVSSDMVLDTLRPKMNELKLLLIPEILSAKLTDGQTKSGTTRFMTELIMSFVWVDCESGEQKAVPFYAQGTDLAGEKGVGKALTYAEKYFLMKFFHIGTSKDDPDNDGRTGSGDKPQKGTQAAKETADYCREAISQMIGELFGGDAEKIKQALIVFTKNDSRQYAGVDNAQAISDAAVNIVYAKVKKKYEEKTGHAFAFKKDEGNDEE